MCVHRRADIGAPLQFHGAATMTRVQAISVRRVRTALGRAWPAAAGLALVPATLAGAQTRPIRVTEFCANSACHADMIDRPFVHGPTGQDACLDCHEYASARRHTFRLTRSNAGMCADCHEDTALQGWAARRPHRPMADGCTSCHDPHGSVHASLLREPETDLCLMCHNGVRTHLGRATVRHGPTLEGDACGTCHDPHAIRGPSPKIPARSALCLSCHNEAIETWDGRMLSNMTAVLEENPNHHGPIADDDCTGCHEAHAAEHAGLLLEAYPPDFYAPYEPRQYGLCFRCHPQRMVESESGTGLTGFRDGDRNLHMLHVNQPKGRTCRACHDVHASKQPFHIREAVPFGDAGYMIRLNYRQSTGGGACAPGCHQPRSYVREK
jgi:predicted CXXCH cytochrome family protein